MQRASRVGVGLASTLILAVATVDTRAASCPAAVVVSGSDGLAPQVRDELLRRDIALEAPPECSLVSAVVEGEPSNIHVAIVDAAGRKSERHVSSVLTAVSLIESWVRTDLTQSLLAPSPASGPDPQPRAAVLARDEPSSAALATNDAPTQTLAGWGGLRGETSVAFDGSLWFGGALSGCVMLGPLCAGGVLRALSDTEIEGDGQAYNSGRFSAEVQATASLPLRMGPARLSPGLGLGLGWTRVTSREPSLDREPVDVDGGSPRLSVFTSTSLPLGNGIFFESSLFIELTPLAHTGSYAEDGLTLAGEPSGRVGMGLGLTLGSP